MLALQREFAAQIEKRLIWFAEEIFNRVPTNDEIRRNFHKYIWPDGHMTYTYMGVPLMHAWWWPDRTVAYRIELAAIGEQPIGWRKSP